MRNQSPTDQNAQSPPHPLAPRTQGALKLLPWIFGLWVMGVIFAFWWFDARYLRVLDQHAVFEGQKFAEASIPVSERPRVVTFNQGSCRCVDPAVDHVKDLKNRFGSDAEFVDSTELSDTLPQLSQVASQLNVSPAVAIWDRQGQLAYFGPYSSGSICGEGLDFVEYTLTELEAGTNPSWINQSAVGCYCIE